MAISWDMPIPGFHVSYAASLHEVLEDRITASPFLFHVRGGGMCVYVCTEVDKHACMGVHTGISQRSILGVYCSSGASHLFSETVSHWLRTRHLGEAGW